MSTVTFIAPSSAFAKALTAINPAVASNPVVPALECFIMSCEGDLYGKSVLKLGASNLETTLTATLGIECKEPWSAAVPAKELLATLKGFPDAPVTCTVNQDTHAFTLSVGKSKYTLTGQSPSDFPRTPALHDAHDAVTLPERLLREALAATLPSVSLDELRPQMNGLLVEGTAAGLRFVSTDGHRLVYHNSAAGTAGVSHGTRSFIFPRTAAQLLLGRLNPKSDAPVTLLVDGQNIRLADHSFTTRLVDERYPDYHGVLPESSPFSLDVDAGELSAALRRLVAYTPDTKDQLKLVSLTIAEAGEVTLRAENANYGKFGRETVQGDYQGEPLTIGLNAAFLIQALALWPAATVRLGITAVNRAVILTRTDEAGAPTIKALLMPMAVAVPV